MIPKFRVFHNGNMRDVKSIDWLHEKVWLATVYGIPSCEYVSFNEVLLMQSTGLKDKKGVEIYEGDIVKVIEDSIFGGTYLGVIKFIEHLGVYGFSMYNTNVLETRKYSKDSIGFNLKTFGNYFTLTEAMHCKNKFEIEVVGNAYANHELMEEIAE
ncbi:YopX family protein [Staphylococcus agnetis]|uniref:YopX family protein n=1 Tax=Staphylococcus agnetis TaxID=985762 RepID=UPI001FB1ED6D|nr:YopX family protein [Staphylococcus agnetis]UOC12413.1 hypothetical protein K2V63_07640 [Staphylococcus agnetis]